MIARTGARDAHPPVFLRTQEPRARQTESAWDPQPRKPARDDGGLLQAPAPDRHALNSDGPFFTTVTPAASVTA